MVVEIAPRVLELLVLALAVGATVADGFVSAFITAAVSTSAAPLLQLLPSAPLLPKQPPCMRRLAVIRPAGCVFFCPSTAVQLS
mgnify:CR=1 FL=1